MADTEMREPTLFILASLAGGQKHGYAMINDVAALSDGRVRLKVATLYAALDRLGTQGLVAPAGEESVDGRLRRYYALTEPGSDALERELQRIEANARQLRSRLQARPASMRAALGGIA
ncbi:PadR family transcriptional regulator [Microterricola viridarii]|uniref:Transcriptional regulator PadR-like family protein n=1 Tax=Microterricola viridarii TaxID=412690 RepID=A0A1H1S4B3_9MICO|nr:PadR family transcriptional regulator [Microterricola viridarii]SDS42865.1 Transcriptional regulator PadR-like family protein [Microterricola viridarii]